MALGRIVAVCGFSAAAAATGRAFTSLGLSAGEKALEDSWDHDLEASTKSPVKRVVELLQKMKSQLEAEGSTESSLYERMVCWCKTNDEEKSKAIADADAASLDLESQIGVRAARHGTLATEIDATKQFIAQEKDSLAQASAIREREASQLSKEETNTIQILTNLKNAIEILSKHHGGSLLQMDSPLFASITAVVRDATLQYEIMVGDPVVVNRALRSGASLLAVSKRNLASAIRKEMGTEMTDGVMPVDIAASVLAKAVHASLGGAFVQAEPSKPTSYSSRSSVIYGLLKQMKDEFESTLSQIQKDELSKRESFAALAASKSEQIEAAQKKLDSIEGEHADNEKALSDANENLALTREQRSADVEFLRNLKLQCQSLDQQWKDRSATRSEEIKAVTEAIAILTDDDARDLLHHSVSFVQEQSISSSASAVAALRSHVAAMLRKAAASPLAGVESNDLLDAWNGRSSASSKLSTLAVSVELDSFAEVKKIMDKMVADLKVQQDEEVKSKDHCESELKGNEKMTYAKSEVKKDLESKLEELAEAVNTMEAEIKAANAEIAETQVQVKKAGEAREKENAAFQTVVNDQRATQNILQKALSRLDAFYKSKATEVQQASLLQRRASTGQTPPEQFNTYKNNAGSSSVMGLLEQIVEDSKRLESEAIAGETTAQAQYEEFVKNSNKVISEAEAFVVARTNSIADAKAQSASTSSDHRSVVEELESLAQYNSDLHIECDFLLKNFDIRQRARLAEIEAINQAKAYLSGQFKDF